MPDDQLPPLPADEPTPWLARHRKLAILVGLATLLGATVVITVIIPRRTPPATRPALDSTSSTNAPAAAANYDRPTFQRSTVTNTPTTLPPAYRPPTQQDLRQAIDQLKNANSTK